MLENPNSVAAAGLVRARAGAEARRAGAAGARPRARQRPGRRYVLIVNDKNVVEQRRVETGQMVGELRMIRERAPAEDRVVVGGIRARSRGRRSIRRCRPPSPPRPRLRRTEVAPSNDLQVLHRAAGLRQRDRHPHGRDRRRGAVRLPVAQYPNIVPPTVAGHHALSRRQRLDRRRDRGAADRAAGQRRRGHALHAVDRARPTAPIR